jgi:homoserine O-acetyltransferase
MGENRGNRIMTWAAKLGTAIVLGLGLLAGTASAQPARRDGDFVIRNFPFHTGETLPELKLHYTTLGNPNGTPVLLLHGTNGNGAGMIAGFNPLFAPGAPLDAATHYIILPDAIGSGGSSKPSDGLKAKFPRYNYDDMVTAQYRLLTEGLGVKHLRLVIGNSMGGMNVWLWGVKYPAMMDGLVPMASQPSAMSGRNWMMRRLLIESIKDDPGYNNGDYAQQPKAMRLALAMFDTGTNGGEIALAAAAPTAAAADALVERRLGPVRGDANDTIWQFAASHDYDPSPNLSRISAPVLSINSADDERNPLATGTLARDIARLKNARLYVIPASAQTRGHGTAGNTTLWLPQLRDFLATLPKR